MRRGVLAWIVVGGCLVPPILSATPETDAPTVAETDRAPSGDTFDGTWADTDGGDSGRPGGGDSGDSGPAGDTGGGGSGGGGNGGGGNGGGSNGGGSGFPGGSTCGNGVREGSETCDGNDLDGLTCATLGLGSGTLACQASICELDKSGCRPGPQSYCTDTCSSLWVGDGDCDDGGSMFGGFGICSFGTDCTDCGTRRTQGTACRNSCILDHDGECNDGGPGSSGFIADFCDLGTDCADCGPR